MQLQRVISRLLLRCVDMRMFTVFHSVFLLVGQLTQIVESATGCQTVRKLLQISHTADIGLNPSLVAHPCEIYHRRF